MKASVRLRGLVCLLALGASGCSTWRAGSLPAGPAAEQVPVVRVTFENGSSLLLHRPTVIADSIHGWSADPDRVPAAAPVSFATAEVVRVEHRQHQTGRTGLLITGVVVGAGVLGAVALYFAAMSAWSSS